MNKKADIQTKEDISLVVKSFYASAMDDPIIGFFFTQISPIELDPHVEKVARFWSALIFADALDEPSNEGAKTHNMLEKHIDLDGKARIQTGHFTRWLYLFHKSVDDNFSGDTADNLKSLATKMANSMSDAIRVKRGERRVGVETLND